MRLENLAIAVIIFGLVMMTGFTIILNQASNYELTTDTDLFSNFTEVQSDAVSESENLRNDIQIRRTSDDDSDVISYKQSYPGSLDIYGWGTLGNRILNLASKQGLSPTTLRPP